MLGNIRYTLAFHSDFSEFDPQTIFFFDDEGVESSDSSERERLQALLQKEIEKS